MIIGAALLIAALSLLLSNRAEDEAAGTAAEAVMPELIAAIKAPQLESREDEPENTEMTVAEIDGEEYIGYLSIPVLNLELPVMSTWDDTKLQIAPCRYFGSSKSGDLVICGHNFSRHFGNLKNLQAGDMLFFTDMDGYILAYEVSLVETLQPTQISEMLESSYELSLFTCTYGGQSRVTVRCRRVDL